MEVILLAAISLDGFITRHDEAGVRFTSRADKAWFEGFLKTCDCSVIGRKTFEVSRKKILENVAEGNRFQVVMTRKPEACQKDAIPSLLEFSGSNPETILRRFSDAGKSRCAILGGGSVYHRFLKEGHVDILWITVEPRLFGTGTPLIGGALDLRLNLLSSTYLAKDTLLLKYRPLQGGG